MNGPTIHQLRAAYEVAKIIDLEGNDVEDVRETYRLVLTQGEHRREHLIDGEALLLSAGLLIASGERLIPSEALFTLARLERSVALRALAHRLSSSGDDQLRDATEIGERGEIAVVAASVDELNRLGRPDVAEGVQRVSLVDDQAGFDVFAPTITGMARQLEVKTMGRPPVGTFRFFISRNEYETGRREPRDWALVACHLQLEPTSPVKLLGWCRAQSLVEYVPEDGSGRWTEALVHLPITRLQQSLPPGV